MKFLDWILKNLKKSYREAFPERKESRSLVIRLEFLGDLRDRQYAQAFFSILDKWKMPKPKYWEGGNYRTVKLEPGAEGPLYEAWERGEFAHLYLRKDGERVSYAVKLRSDYDPNGYKPHWRMPKFHHHMDEEWLSAHPAVSWEKIIGFCTDLYALCKPVYGFTRLWRYEREGFESSIVFSIPSIYWLNFFGVPYVEMIGSDRLASAPCHKVIEMPDGGFLLVLTPTPAEALSKEGRAKAELVKQHLGMEYFYQKSDGKCWSELKGRETPDFDWSKAPLETFTPATEDPADFMNDPEGFIGRVPELVADLKKRMGDWGTNLDCSQKSLEELDVWLLRKWRKDPENEMWDSQDLWGELTAYVGEVARTATNGEWKIEEIQPGTTSAVVCPIGGRHRRFEPLSLVQELILEGLDGAEESEVGILETGLAPGLSVWLLTHKI